MLMWHNAWMARHGREIADEMRRVGTAVSEGAKPLTALAVVVGLAVLREGSEVVLFLYGILASGTAVSATLLGVLGIVAGAVFTALTYFGLLAIPSRYIFSVTSWLIALLTTGMAAQSVHFLNNAGLVHGARQDGLGYVVAAVGRQHFRPAAACPDRLHRAANADAVAGLHRSRSLRCIC